MFILFLITIFYITPNFCYSLKSRTFNPESTPTEVKNKKLINMYPAGIRGFYTLGVCKYIKDNYDLSKFIFSGASAGAWNGLFMIHNGNNEKMLNDIFSLNYKDASSIQNIEYLLKEKIIEKYDESNFDLNRLFIGVSVLDNIFCLKKEFLKKELYYDFDNLEDVVDCCIASSHIPFLTGGLFRKYQNKISFDGGIKEYPFLDIIKPTFEITPTLWLGQKDAETAIKNSFKRKDVDFRKLFDDGYNLSYKNRHKLDNIFI